MNIEEEIFGITKKVQSINQKLKGNRNELAVTKILTDWTGHEFVRVPRSGGLRWKNRMDICGDVINADPAFDFPFSVETKHVKSLGFDPYKKTLRVNSVVYTYWGQAVRDAASVNKIPLMLLRDNGMPKNWYYLFLVCPTRFQAVKLIAYCPYSYEEGLIKQREKLNDLNIFLGFPVPAFFKRFTYKRFKDIII